MSFSWSSAMLEKLAHGNGRLPPNQHFITITIPKGTSFEMVTRDHLPGWDAWTREVARKFAEQGYAAIAPHLFSRWGPGEPDDVAARARASWGPSDPEAMGDIGACARYLRAQPYSSGKVGCIGFCSGGRQAYLAASQVADLDAAVDC